MTDASKEKDNLIESNSSEEFASILSLSSLKQSRIRTKTRFFFKSTLVHIPSLPFWRRVLFLVLIAVSCTCTINCSTMFFPFFPIYAENVKKVSPVIIGNITGLMYFFVFIFCILFGVFIKLLGPKLLFFTGYLTLTVSLFLFGFLDRVDTFWFVFYSFALTLTISVSLAAIYTSSYSLGMAMFPANQNTVLAIIDTIGGIGYILGPIEGGLLFDRLGWSWTWVINAIVILVCTLFSLFYLPLIDIDRVESESIKDYLNIFRLIPNINVLAVIIVNLVITISWSYQYTSLGPFLERTYNSSSETIGYVFSIPNVSYTLLLPIIGIISEKCGARFFIWLSMPVQVLSLVLTPPLHYIFTDRAYSVRDTVNVSLFPIPGNSRGVNYIAVTFIGQFLIGVGYTLAFGAMYVDMECHTSDKLKKKLGNLPEILSSIRISTYFLANGLGPIMSGLLEPVISFDDETLVFIFVVILTFLLFTPLSIWNFIYLRHKRKKKRID